MASISTCFNLPPNSRFLSTSIVLRPPNHLQRVLLPPRFPPKLRLPHARVPIVRASIDVASAIRPGGAVESDKLPSDVRKRAMDAVDSSGRRVTIGDVASRAGLKLNEAQTALQALAADTDGFLEVSDEGDVLYVFPKDYRTKLAAKSFRIKIEPWVDKAKATGEYLVRVSFGTALVASIVIVFTAIIAIISSKSDDDNRDRRGRRGRSFDSGFNFYFSPTDLFWYWDPYYYKRRRVEADANKKLNFIESVFSFVFGDGDPNQGIEEERWKMIGQYIASKGGVVAAEELAPYLDITNVQDRNDESYILPVLIRFDGQPEIDEEQYEQLLLPLELANMFFAGNILYRFPSLQRTAASSQRSGKKEYVWDNWVSGVENFFQERKWEFSKSGPSERALVIGLGGLNLFGVVVLGTMLMEANPIGYIKFVATIFPLLQIYAGSFFAIPLMRWFILRQRNAEIEKRNLARVSAAKALERPDISLRRKLLSARDMAQRTVIGQDRIVYSTEKDLVDQDYDAREWERRFKEIE